MSTEQPNPNWTDWKKPQKIVELCGIGLVWYQKYLQSLIILNVVLSFISLIPIGAHIHAGSRDMDSSTLSLSNINDTRSEIENQNAFASVIFLLTTASYLEPTHVFVYAYMGLFLAGLLIHFLLY